MSTWTKPAILAALLPLSLMNASGADPLSVTLVAGHVYVLAMMVVLRFVEAPKESRE